MINLFSSFCYVETFVFFQNSPRKNSCSFLFFFPFSLSLYSKSKLFLFPSPHLLFKIGGFSFKVFFSIPSGIITYSFPIQFNSHQDSFHLPHVPTYSSFFFLCSIITFSISHAVFLGLPLEFKN